MYLGGGLKYFLYHPYLGKIPILTNIFQVGWKHQLGMYGYLQIIQIIYVYFIIFLFIARISDSIVYTGLYASYIICICT